jgi:hypothetical protein
MKTVTYHILSIANETKYRDVLNNATKHGIIIGAASMITDGKIIVKAESLLTHINFASALGAAGALCVCADIKESPLQAQFKTPLFI